MAEDKKVEEYPSVGARFPRLRKLAVLAATIGLTYLGARLGIPVAAPEVAPVQAAAVELHEFDTAAPVCGGPAIVGATAYPVHGLVRLEATGVDPDAAVVWKVTPRAGVDRATTAEDVLQFAAPPGTYEVDLMVLSKLGDKLTVREVFTRVTIGAKKDDEKKPDPEKKPEPKSKPDALKALGRVQFGNGSCTATVVAPRRADGRWDVLCASHCMDGVGSKGTLHTKDGRKLAVRVAVHDKRPDVAWLVTEDATLSDLAYAEIAATNPAVGVKVWHAGYGIDKPNNREDGEVLYSEQPDGKTTFHLSVSPGDSGGGIFRDDTNELVATVCCTSALAEKARMSAGGVNAIRKLRPGVVRLDELPEPAAAGHDCRATLRGAFGLAW